MAVVHKTLIVVLTLSCGALVYGSDWPTLYEKCRSLEGVFCGDDRAELNVMRVIAAPGDSERGRGRPVVIFQWRKNSVTNEYAPMRSGSVRVATTTPFQSAKCENCTVCRVFVPSHNNCEPSYNIDYFSAFSGENDFVQIFKNGGYEDHLQRAAVNSTCPKRPTPPQVRTHSQWKQKRSNIEREMSCLRTTQFRLEENLAIKDETIASLQQRLASAQRDCQESGLTTEERIHTPSTTPLPHSSIVVPGPPEERIHRKIPTVNPLSINVTVPTEERDYTPSTLPHSSIVVPGPPEERTHRKIPTVNPSSINVTVPT